MIMKKLLSVLPVTLIIIALMAFGGETIAQQQGGRNKANKEVNEAKQKGKEKIKEAEESVQKEEEAAREAAKDEEEKVREAAEAEREGKAYQEKGEKKEGKGKGNAYGRNKGGLEGRDFGQARAEEARMKNQEKKSELDRRVEDGEQRSVQARERIRVAREDLEKEKNSKRIPDDVYQQKKEKIDNAEKAVIDLEEKIKKGKNVPGEI